MGNDQLRTSNVQNSLIQTLYKLFFVFTHIVVAFPGLGIINDRAIYHNMAHCSVKV